MRNEIIELGGQAFITGEEAVAAQPYFYDPDSAKYVRGAATYLPRTSVDAAPRLTPEQVRSRFKGPPDTGCPAAPGLEGSEGIPDDPPEADEIENDPDELPDPEGEVDDSENAPEDAPEAPEAVAPLPAKLQEMTIGQLRQYALDHGINISGASKRVNIISVIEDAQANGKA